MSSPRGGVGPGRAAGVGVVVALLVALLGGAPAGAATRFGSVASVVHGIAAPVAMAMGADGNVWFTSGGNNTIGRVTPAGELTWFADPRIDHPGAIAAGADGRMWFANQTDRNGAESSLGQITTDGVVTTITGVVRVTALTAGPDGRVWLLGDDVAIRAVGDDGVVTSYPVLTEPNGDIVSGPDGKLWFTGQSGTIGRITPAGVPMPPIQAAASTSALTVGPDGNVWFGGFSTSPRLGSVAPSGAVTTFLYDGPQSADLVTGADGNLWFVPSATFYRSSPEILRMTPEGRVDRFPLPAPADALLPGPGGDVWFVSSAGGMVGRVTPAGVVSARARTQVRGPQRIVTGPDGNLWFTNQGGSSIGRLTAGGAITTFTGPGVLRPVDITNGPDGNLWFTNAVSIGRITPAGVVTKFAAPGIQTPSAIVTGPDGNLWFTELYANAIGRITPAGVITRFTDTVGARPKAIVSAPDGYLYFGTETGLTIQRISTSGAVEVVSDLNVAGWDAADLTIGPDGNVWFTDAFRSTVAVIDLHGPDAPAPPVVVATVDRGTGFDGRYGLSGLTAGPDGDIWFVQQDVDEIFRVGTDVFDPPGAPTAVAGTPGRGVVHLEWLAPVSVGDGPLTSYVITPFVAGVAQPARVVPSSVTSAEIDGLADATTFTFIVTAASAGGAGPPSAASAPVRTWFSDVTPAEAFFGDITWLADRGIAMGYGDGSFRPLEPQTRRALAAFLYRYAGSPEGPNPACSHAVFPDVEEPFCGEIEWLHAQGLAHGFADGGFHPDAPISRQAFAAFLYRFVGSPAGTPAPCATDAFADVPRGAPFCGEVAWLKAQGIAAGYPDGGFHPTAPVSRQAVAAFLHRLDQLP